MGLIKILVSLLFWFPIAIIVVFLAHIIFPEIIPFSWKLALGLAFLTGLMIEIIAGHD